LNKDAVKSTGEYIDMCSGVESALCLARMRMP